MKHFRPTSHSEAFNWHSEGKPKNLVFSCLLSASCCLLFISLLLCSNVQAAATPQIAAGSEHTVALKSDGTLWAWGANWQGQLGDGTTVDRLSPVRIGSDTDWLSIAAGGQHTIALKSDGTLWAWGRNYYGQIGDGTNTTRTSPARIGSDTDWLSIAAGGQHTIALKSDGTLWAWGYNYYGQLGQDTNIDRWVPAQVGSASNWVSIAAGGYHTIALKSDGTLWAWGGNIWGTLGDGTTVDRWVPVQIGSDTNWDSIAAGANHTLALKSDGTRWAWGPNWHGEIGDGTNTARILPVQIGTDTNWGAIAAGDYYTIALKSDGTLWAWGANDHAQLGDGTQIDKNAPVQIGTDTNWGSIAAGEYHTIALKSDGTLWAWGYNSSGQLGDGTYHSRFSPVQIMSLWVPENCTNGMDDDEDGLVDCDDPECCGSAACFTNPQCNILSETLLSRQAVMNNVETIAPDFAGTSTLYFTDLEFVKITTGSFAEKGFSKGNCEVTFEGTAYSGEWKGVTFLKPQERKVYLKGAVTGQINAAVEGYLTESVPNSGDYDQYQAIWKIGRLGASATSAIIDVNGTLSYQDTEYPGTDLYLLQANIGTTPSGDYAPDPLDVVLTHLRVVREDSPYVGEGFSIISYNSKSGSGQGWTYDKLLPQGTVRMEGLFSSPLYGIAIATLDDRTLLKTLSMQIKRIDLSLPPLADLYALLMVPTWVSPGQMLDVMIEYGNNGTVMAENVVVICNLPTTVDYVSSTGSGIYRWETHEVLWKLGPLLPGKGGLLSAKIYYPWGLESGSSHPIIVLSGTTTADKDHFLNPDYEDLFTLQDYLDYQPLQITSSEMIPPEEFSDLLSSDAGVADLHQYAVDEGFSNDLSAINLSTNEGDATIVLLSNSSNEPRFIISRDGQSLLMEYTETTITFFDRDGGMTFDTTNNVLDYWGGWTSSELSRALGPLDIYVPPCNKYFGCVMNCITVNLAKEILKKAHKLLKAVIKAIGCQSCLTNKDAPCKCLGDLTKQLPIVGQILGILKCKDKCKKEAEDFCCKGDKVYCDGNLIWLKCDTDTGLMGNAEIIQKPGECQKCAGDRILETPDDCRPKVRVAKDPNIKYGPGGAVSAGQTLDYTVEFENVGEGIAFGVYFTDILDEDLDDSTLAIGPVRDVKTDAVIGEPGFYYSNTRIITWLVGNGREVGSKEGGYADISVNVRNDAPRGTEIINYGTVYFPSVPEKTRTNAVVSIIPANEICGNSIDDDGDDLIDCDDPECFGRDCPELCDDGWDNDGDGVVDENCDTGPSDDGPNHDGGGGGGGGGCFLNGIQE